MRSWKNFVWIFLAAAALLLPFIVFGMPRGFILLPCIAVVLVFAFRFPLFAVDAFMATALLINWFASIDLSQYQWSERAFGGSIDIGVSELIAVLALCVCGVRILLYYFTHRRAGWRPWFPFALSFGAVMVATLLSGFSPALPDPIGVIKFAARPVLLVYLTCIVLLVNVIQSRARFIRVLWILSGVGVLLALNGFWSLFPWSGLVSWPHTAQPLPVFGVFPIGDNHNALGECLVLLAPLTLALSTLVRRQKTKRLAVYAAAGMTLIALLTFARSAWLAIGAQTIFLGATICRPWVRRYKRNLIWIAVIALPFVALMGWYSLQAEAVSSTAARATLARIAWELFASSPWIGVGAGTFVERVSHVFAFRVEFGAPMDAHGLIQKIAAETGLLGLLAFFCVWRRIASDTARAWQTIREDFRADLVPFAFLVSAVIGSLVYQLFSTTLWTPRLWLPVGLLFVAIRLFVVRINRDPAYVASYE